MSGSKRIGASPYGIGLFGALSNEAAFGRFLDFMLPPPTTTPQLDEGKGGETHNSLSDFLGYLTRQASRRNGNLQYVLHAQKPTHSTLKTVFRWLRLGHRNRRKGKAAAESASLGLMEKLPCDEALCLPDEATTFYGFNSLVRTLFGYQKESRATEGFVSTGLERPNVTLSTDSSTETCSIDETKQPDEARQRAVLDAIDAMHRRLLFFFHVPKTAGKATQTVIKKLFRLFLLPQCNEQSVYHRKVHLYIRKYWWGEKIDETESLPPFAAHKSKRHSLFLREVSTNLVSFFLHSVLDPLLRKGREVSRSLNVKSLPIPKLPAVPNNDIRTLHVPPLPPGMDDPEPFDLEAYEKYVIDREKEVRSALWPPLQCIEVHYCKRMDFHFAYSNNLAYVLKPLFRGELSSPLTGRQTSNGQSNLWQQKTDILEYLEYAMVRAKPPAQVIRGEFLQRIAGEPVDDGEGKSIVRYQRSVLKGYEDAVRALHIYRAARFALPETRMVLRRLKSLLVRSELALGHVDFSMVASRPVVHFPYFLPPAITEAASEGKQHEENKQCKAKKVVQMLRQRAQETLSASHVLQDSLSVMPITVLRHPVGRFFSLYSFLISNSYYLTLALQQRFMLVVMEAWTDFWDQELKPQLAGYLNRYVPVWGAREHVARGSTRKVQSISEKPYESDIVDLPLMFRVRRPGAGLNKSTFDAVRALRGELSGAPYASNAHRLELLEMCVAYGLLRVNMSPSHLTMNSETLASLKKVEGQTPMEDTEDESTEPPKTKPLVPDFFHRSMVPPTAEKTTSQAPRKDESHTTVDWSVLKLLPPQVLDVMTRVIVNLYRHPEVPIRGPLDNNPVGKHPQKTGVSRAGSYIMGISHKENSDGVTLWSPHIPRPVVSIQLQDGPENNESQDSSDGTVRSSNLFVHERRLSRLEDVYYRKWILSQSVQEGFKQSSMLRRKLARSTERGDSSAYADETTEEGKGRRLAGSKLRLPVDTGREGDDLDPKSIPDTLSSGDSSMFNESEFYYDFYLVSKDEHKVEFGTGVPHSIRLKDEVIQTQLDKLKSYCSMVENKPIDGPIPSEREKRSICDELFMQFWALRGKPQPATQVGNDDGDNKVPLSDAPETKEQESFPLSVSLPATLSLSLQTMVFTYDIPRAWLPRLLRFCENGEVVPLDPDHVPGEPSSSKRWMVTRPGDEYSYENPKMKSKWSIRPSEESSEGGKKNSGRQPMSVDAKRRYESGWSAPAQSNETKVYSGYVPMQEYSAKLGKYRSRLTVGLEGDTMSHWIRKFQRPHSAEEMKKGNDQPWDRSSFFFKMLEAASVPELPVPPPPPGLEADSRSPRSRQEHQKYTDLPANSPFRTPIDHTLSAVKSHHRMVRNLLKVFPDRKTMKSALIDRFRAFMNPFNEAGELNFHEDMIDEKDEEDSLDWGREFIGADGLGMWHGSDPFASKAWRKRGGASKDSEKQSPHAAFFAEQKIRRDEVWNPELWNSWVMYLSKYVYQGEAVDWNLRSWEKSSDESDEFGEGSASDSMDWDTNGASKKKETEDERYRRIDTHPFCRFAGRLVALMEDQMNAPFMPPFLSGLFLDIVQDVWQNEALQVVMERVENRFTRAATRGALHSACFPYWRYDGGPFEFATLLHHLGYGNYQSQMLLGVSPFSLFGLTPSVLLNKQLERPVVNELRNAYHRESDVSPQSSEGPTPSQEATTALQAINTARRISQWDDLFAVKRHDHCGCAVNGGDPNMNCTFNSTFVEKKDGLQLLYGEKISAMQSGKSQDGWDGSQMTDLLKAVVPIRDRPGCLLTEIQLARLLHFELLEQVKAKIREQASEDSKQETQSDASIPALRALLPDFRVLTRFSSPFARRIFTRFLDKNPMWNLLRWLAPCASKSDDGCGVLFSGEQTIALYDEMMKRVMQQSPRHEDESDDSWAFQALVKMLDVRESELQGKAQKFAGGSLMQQLKALPMLGNQVLEVYRKKLRDDDYRVPQLMPHLNAYVPETQRHGPKPAVTSSPNSIVPYNRVHIFPFVAAAYGAQSVADLAVMCLERYAFFGLTERFSQSVELLGDAMYTPITPETAVHLSSTTVNPTLVKYKPKEFQGVAEYVLKIDGIDALMYDKAKDVFDTRYKGMHARRQGK